MLQFFRGASNQFFNPQKQDILWRKAYDLKITWFCWNKWPQAHIISNLPARQKRISKRGEEM